MRPILAFSHTTTSAQTPSLPDPSQLNEHAAFANELADAARQAILPHWRQPSSSLKIDSKYEVGRSPAQSVSPVTIADREAERAMRTLIVNRYPTHGIYGEEYGTIRTDAEWVWVLDPIDGTRSFVSGKPLFGTLVSCLYRGVPVVGIIDQCVLNERWVGVMGRSSTFNGEPIRTSSDCERLSDAMMFATTPDMFAQGYESDRFHAMKCSVNDVQFGADCYAYGLVASGFGKADVVVEADLGLYDYCALVPVVVGAGGVMSDWEGRTLCLENHERGGGRVVACSNKKLHGEALSVLGSGSDRSFGGVGDVGAEAARVPALLVGILIGMALARIT